MSEPAHIGERWAPIPGHPKYEASTHGRVRAVKTGRVLKPQGHTRGYLKVHLGQTNGVRHQMTVHRAVALAHIPLPGGGDLFTAWQVDHLDFNRQNNHAENLRWLPAEINRRRYMRDAIAHDTEQELETPPMTAAEEAAFDEWHEAAGW